MFYGAYVFLSTPSLSLVIDMVYNIHITRYNITLPPRNKVVTPYSHPYLNCPKNSVSVRVSAVSYFPLNSSTTTAVSSSSVARSSITSPVLIL